MNMKHRLGFELELEEGKRRGKKRNREIGKNQNMSKRLCRVRHPILRCVRKSVNET